MTASRVRLGCTRGGDGRPLPLYLPGIVFAIAGSERDFKLENLVPLGLASLAIRNREQRLEALAWRSVFGSVHVGIIAGMGRSGVEKIVAATPCGLSTPRKRTRCRSTGYPSISQVQLAS